MRAWFKMIAWVAAVFGSLLLALYALVFDVWRVPTDDPLLAASVEPTLSAGEVVLVMRHGSFGRGNLLRCPDPQAPGRFVIARAMARSGEKLEISGESVHIDGHRTPSPRACDEPQVIVRKPNTDDDVQLACSVEDFGEMDFSALRALDQPEPPTSATVEEGKWFLVSDDRHFHLDSRDYGQLEPSACQHIVFRLVGAAGFKDDKKRLDVIW
jgi:signal peptidase I